MKQDWICSSQPKLHCLFSPLCNLADLLLVSEISLGHELLMSDIVSIEKVSRTDKGAWTSGLQHNRDLMSQVLEARSPRSRSQQGLGLP